MADESDMSAPSQADDSEISTTPWGGALKTATSPRTLRVCLG
jgi:hypothetical protein